MYTKSAFLDFLHRLFKGMVPKEYMWLDTVSQRIDSILRRSMTLENMKLEKIKLNIEGLLRLASIFHGIIDFRSRYTATHSSGVAASSEAIARVALDSLNMNV